MPPRIGLGPRCCAGPGRERASALPPSPERLVELNDAQQLVQLDLPQVELGLKQIPVSIQGVELGIDAPLISHVGQPFPLPKDRNKSLLLYPGVPHSLVSDQCIGNFGERSLNDLLVLHHCAVTLGLRQPHVRPQAAGGKDGLAELWNEAPGATRSVEKTGQLTALPADQPA